MAGNPWDYSQILLSNNAGANIGRGIEQAGRGFAKGIEAWAQAEDKRKKEDATVEWLESTPEAVNAMFPKLAQVQDPAERKKAIKAGIKGAGLENVMQVQGYMEQQKARAAQARIAEQMAGVNMDAERVRTQKMRADMMRDQANDVAVRTAYRPGAVFNEKLMTGGLSWKDTAPDKGDQRLQVYLRSGGSDANIIKQMQSEGGDGMNDLRFVEDSVSGARFAVGPKGTFSGSGFNPAKAPKKPVGGRSEYQEISDALDATGAFDKPADQLTGKEKSLLARLTALNTRGGSAMTPEQMAARIAGDEPPAAPLSEQDQKALDWANANPKDPRSAKIKAKLGIQ